MDDAKYASQIKRKTWLSIFVTRKHQVRYVLKKVEALRWWSSLLTMLGNRYCSERVPKSESSVARLGIRGIPSYFQERHPLTGTGAEHNASPITNS